LEGLYLLKGKGPFSFVITDDFLHNDQRRLLFAADIQPHSSLIAIPDSHASFQNDLPEIAFGENDTINESPEFFPGNNRFIVDWHTQTGRGYVAQTFPNGTRLVTSFSRYHEGMGAVPSGLFVGGNIPLTVDLPGEARNNASGMTYFDGKRWNHIWCDVNEAILARRDGREVAIPPSKWRYLGSRLVRNTGTEVLITSSHAVTDENLSLHVDRYVYFRAGAPYFLLVSRITNTGNSSAQYAYVYGDEPWIGNYGSSRGDVGWTAGSLVTHEGQVDLTRNSFAGMYDYGNDLLHEGHRYTRLASFIDWGGGDRPDQVFFSNSPGSFIPGSHSPLTGDTRFIGLHWGPKNLPPMASNQFVTAIGMAQVPKHSALPVKPAVTFSASDLLAMVN
jgi:hypothetical protein